MENKMTVKRNIRESRSIFARLLAQENVQVDFDPQQPTASFDIKNRVLTLPVLKDMQTFHYDGFIAHEVGHALHTPDDKKYDELYENRVPFDFVNITEDARIEKLVQQKYQGLKKDFYDMYKDFASPEKNFFDIEGKDINTLPLIDRVNLFFKIGKFKNVQFQDQEKPLVQQVADARTFDEALNAAIAIYDYMKQNNQNPPKPSGKPKSGGGKGKGKGEKSQENKSQDGTPEDSDAGFTQRSFEKNREKMTQSDSKQSCNIGETADYSEFNYDRMIDKSIMKRLVSTKPMVDKEFKTFLNTINPTVNMMVTQFNMRKSAREWNKTQVSKTGKLDMSNISMYRVSSDVFSSNEVHFTEKNHGFIFFIDYSGSMDAQILNTVKQMIVTLQFCKKAQIPFEVYGFTSKGGKSPLPASENKITTSYANDAHIFKIIDSTLKLKDYNTALNNLFNMSGGSSTAPALVSMASTPLLTAALASDFIVERFKNVYKREKTILVLLSDGEPSDSIQKKGSNANRTVIVDKYTYKNYEIQTFHDLFRYVKDRNNVTKMIGFFLSAGITQHMAHTVNPDFKKSDYKKVEKEFANKRYAVFDKGRAFDKFFIIDVNNFKINDKEMKAFEKQLESKHTGSDLIDNLNKAVRGKLKPMVFMKVMIDEIS
jgi:uncharacterized protein YegL